MSVENKIKDLQYELYSSSMLEKQKILSYKNVFPNRNGDNYEISINVAPYKEKVSIAKIVRNYILTNNLTVTSFANTLLIGRPALSNFLNGKSALSYRLADCLSKYLNISAETLLKIDLEQRYKKYRKEMDDLLTPPNKLLTNPNNKESDE